MNTPPTNPQEAHASIRARIRVTRQMVVQAKSHILTQPMERSDRLLESLVAAASAPKPTTDIHADSILSLEQVATWASWVLAGCEAIWELIHTNFRIPSSSVAAGELGSVRWTGAGTSGYWDFGDLSLLVPSHLYTPPSVKYSGEQPLTDPDLFMREVNIDGINPAVEEALREAVLCLRCELYTACLAMLGKASEGAWIELGLSLLASPEATTIKDANKIRGSLENPMLGIAKKIEEVTKLYERQDVFGSLAKRASIRLADLRNAAIWADVVRDSRNTVHYGVNPAMRNSYEKVSALLIGAVAHLRILYLLRNACSPS